MSNRVRPATSAIRPVVPEQVRAWEVPLGNQGRLLGYGGAMVAVGSFLVLWLPNLGRRAPGSGPSGATYLVIGLALATLMALATLTGRCLAVGIAALLVTAGPWGPESLFQLLYFLLAVGMTGWVIRAALVARRAPVPG